MTEFLQTDIDGSLDYLLNPITIESLEKYLKTFYTPPLDIEQISSIWDQLLHNGKTKDIVYDDVWRFAITATIIPLSIFTSMFHQRFKNTDSLNQLWNFYSSFIFKLESIPQDYNFFPGDIPKFCLKCLCCGKRITPFESPRKILFIEPMAISHHLKILSSVSVELDSIMIFKNLPVLFMSMTNYWASEELFNHSVYEKTIFLKKKLYLSR